MSFGRHGYIRKGVLRKKRVFINSAYSVLWLSNEFHLIKVLIKSESLFNSHLPHDNKAHTISKTEIFIIISLKYINEYLRQHYLVSLRP